MSTSDRFRLTLFSTEPAFIREAVNSGIDEIIVDWEHVGKEERQAFADTEINYDTLADLKRVRKCTDARVLCRINRYSATTKDEVEQVIDAGAHEVLLPMVSSTEEVEAVLRQAKRRCGVGILIETVRATQLADQFARLPLSRVYVGLNDLAIDTKEPNIFTAVADGTVANIRRHFRVPFGFGGLTLPDRGYPIPCRLLIAEMTRLNCNFSFLRRSFHRDIQGRELAVEVPRLREAIHQACLRSPAAVIKDRSALHAAIRAWPKPQNLGQHVLRR